MQNYISEASYPKHERLLELDGLRGLAALAVALYHFNGELAVLIRQHWPIWISDVMSFGYLGVAVFFALSGYAISSSLRGSSITTLFAMKYAARRVLRLDPPYWLSLLVALALAFAKALVFPDMHLTLPGAGCLAGHLFYVQGFLGCANLIDIYWTLCYEVQFYLFLLCVLAVGQKIAMMQGKSACDAGEIHICACVITIVASIAIRWKFLPVDVVGLALDAWCMFGMGCLAYWSVSRRLARWGLALVIAVTVLLWQIGGRHDLNIAVGAGVSILLLSFSRFPNLGVALRAAPLQHLGKTSYSLYLFHGIIGWSVIALLMRWFLAEHAGPWGTFLVFLSGVLSSILCAEIVFRFVEAPSIRLSRRVRLT